MKKWRELRKNIGLAPEDISAIEEHGWERYVEFIVDNLPSWNGGTLNSDEVQTFVRRYFSLESFPSEESRKTANL